MQKYLFYLLTLSLGCTPLMAAHDPVLYIALDTSGSMRNKYQWLADMVSIVRDNSSEAPQLTKSISLHTFTDRAEIRIEGDDRDVIGVIKTISLRGGTEDGLIPIKMIAEKVTGGAHIILITDEDRDKAADIDSEALLRVLREKNITLHAVQSRQIRCGSDQVIAINSQSVATRYDFSEVECDAQRYQRATQDEYIQLALGSGGQVWDLKAMRDKSREYAHLLAGELLEKYDKGIRAEVVIGGAPVIYQALTFDASKTFATEDLAPVNSWQWDFNGDGQVDDYGPVVAYIFETPGTHSVNLILANGVGAQAISKKQIIKVDIRE